MNELLDKEKEIMDIFWSVNYPCVISDILKTNSSLNRNTVAKALVSLEKKDISKWIPLNVPSQEPDELMFRPLPERNMRIMSTC